MFIVNVGFGVRLRRHDSDHLLAEEQGDAQPATCRFAHNFDPHLLHGFGYIFGDQNWFARTQDVACQSFIRRNGGDV